MQSDLLSWRADATTSGPRPTSADGERDDRDYAAKWAAYVDTDDGAEVSALLESTALRLATGSDRVSVRDMLAIVRSSRRTPLNNSWAAPIADWLIGRNPILSDKIERRTRKAKP